ncbi:MAG: DUF1835 domain-containing protein, partial [Victivallaceae bacterium]|nr:DUF1835 domain-containing protein [Victivallaceae bacterium]
MTKSLPPKPSVKFLKLEAKSVLKAHKQGDSSCCEILRHLHQFKGKSDQEILNAQTSLQEVQFALAMDYSFKNWSDLNKYVLGKEDNHKYLHIICGDVAADILRNSTVPGDVQVWMEIFIEGPTPGNVSEEEWRRVRAEFISSQYFTTMSMKSALQGADDRYKNLEKAKNYEEVILWFDACMFDQTLMIHLIDRLAKIDLGNTKLSLICAGECSGFESFNGFGELTPEQMAPFFNTRHEISREEIKLAGDAWKAFTSDNPKDIETLLSGDCSALPYLSNALRRFLQKYPFTQNGLNRTQNQIMKAVNDGATKLLDIFTAVSKMEKPKFMGDTSFWQFIHDLASSSVPLLNVEGPEKLDEISKVDREI